MISYKWNIYFKVGNSFQPTGFMNTVYTFVCIVIFVNFFLFALLETF